jgi:hypothetical protein
LNLLISLWLQRSEKCQQVQSISRGQLDEPTPGQIAFPQVPLDRVFDGECAPIVQERPAMPQPP